MLREWHYWMLSWLGSSRSESRRFCWWDLNLNTDGRFCLGAIVIVAGSFSSPRYVMSSVAYLHYTTVLDLIYYLCNELTSGLICLVFIVLLLSLAIFSDIDLKFWMSIFYDTVPLGFPSLMRAFTIWSRSGRHLALGSALQFELRYCFITSRITHIFFG